MFFLLQNGLTALHKAAKWGHTAVVKQLLDSRNFNVNMQDKVSLSTCSVPCMSLDEYRYIFITSTTIGRRRQSQVPFDDCEYL